MNLTAQQFSEILSFLRPRSEAVFGSDKRRTTRLDLKSEITITPVVNRACQQRVTVLTRDISMEGVGILSAHELSDGQQFIAMLPRGENNVVLVLCQVVHSCIACDGIFSLGCRFVQVLTPHSVQKLDNLPHATDAVRGHEAAVK